MTVYKLHKKGRSGRRVAVMAERIEWNVPAIIMCVLLAIAIWFYIVGVSSKHAGDKIDPATTTEATAVVTSGEVATV